jgi:cell division inhibitor SepF
MSIIGKLKDLMYAYDEEEDEDEDEEFIDEPETSSYHPYRTYREPSKRTPLICPEISPFSASSGRESIQESPARLKIVSYRPSSYNDCLKMVDGLKDKNPVIINLDSVDSDIAKNIFDYLSGATYALNGNVLRIAKNIFVFMPENVEALAE